MFILKIIKALNKANIPYAIAGGCAVALHGAVRGTVDVDIVIEHSEKFFLKIEQVFKDLGLVSRLPLAAHEIFQFRKEYQEKRNLFAWSFVNSNNPTELIDVLLTEDLSELETTPMKIENQTVIVVSKNALIQMKKKVGRPQDLEDVRILKKL